jgi:hypothetical protein
MRRSAMARFLMLFSILVVVSACQVQKTPVATGGSRADAAIQMSYQTGGFETAVVNWDAAQATATQRCQAWGYTRAEGFDGVSTVCNASNMYGCVDSTVTRTYQCLD